jgi:hypothetical protein
MTIIVIDYELPNYICEEFLNKKQFKKWLSAQNEDIYFVGVSDETWDELKTENSKRIELDLDGLTKLIDKSSWLFLIKRNHVRACVYYSKGSD